MLLSHRYLFRFYLPFFRMKILSDQISCESDALNRINCQEQRIVPVLKNQEFDYCVSWIWLQRCKFVIREKWADYSSVKNRRFVKFQSPDLIHYIHNNYESSIGNPFRSEFWCGPSETEFDHIYLLNALNRTL